MPFALQERLLTDLKRDAEGMATDGNLKGADTAYAKLEGMIEELLTNQNDVIIPEPTQVSLLLLKLTESKRLKHLETPVLMWCLTNPQRIIGNSRARDGDSSKVSAKKGKNFFQSMHWKNNAELDALLAQKLSKIPEHEKGELGALERRYLPRRGLTHPYFIQAALMDLEPSIPLRDVEAIIKLTSFHWPDRLERALGRGLLERFLRMPKTEFEKLMLGIGNSENLAYLLTQTDSLELIQKWSERVFKAEGQTQLWCEFVKKVPTLISPPEACTESPK
jgi:hypothetical protein